jgi:hypothetical protein
MNVQCALLHSPIATLALIGKRMQMIVHSFTQQELSLAEIILTHFPTKHIKLLDRTNWLDSEFLL